MALIELKRFLYLLCWRLTGILFPGRWLFLTYDDSRLTDGGGNQALRITAIKAVSALFNIGYRHTPISRIDNHGVAALAGEPIEPTRLAAWNHLVAFRSTHRLRSPAEVVQVDTLRLAHLFHYRRLSAARKQQIILSIAIPYPVIDFFPQAYDLARSHPQPSCPRSPLRIALHVRRGDLMWTHSERLLPIEYYLVVTQRIVTILESLNLQYVCELYSEELSNALTLQPGDHGISPDSKTAVVLDPGSSDLKVLDAIPRLAKFINHDPVDSIQRMASADILVTSRSAFSYLAAINNFDGIVIYHPFWHPPLPAWIRSEQEILFSESLFRRRLLRQLRHSTYASQ